VSSRAPDAQRRFLRCDFETIPEKFVPEQFKTPLSQRNRFTTSALQEFHLLLDNGAKKPFGADSALVWQTRRTVEWLSSRPSVAQEVQAIVATNSLNWRAAELVGESFLNALFLQSISPGFALLRGTGTSRS